MRKSLDTKKVWEALRTDRAFSNGVPEGAMEAFRETVERLPEVLGDQLDAEVTISTLMQAKLDIVEHMLDAGVIARIAAAIPADQLPCPAEELAETLKDAMKQLRMPFMEMIHDTAEFLAQLGMTERQALASPQGGLNAACLKAYDIGKLTIRGLLETQPAVLMANGG